MSVCSMCSASPFCCFRVSWSLVNTADTKSFGHAQLDVTWFSPACTPWVTYKPVILLSIVPNYCDSVVHVSRASIIRHNSTFVWLENSATSIDCNRHSGMVYSSLHGLWIARDIMIFGNFDSTLGCVILAYTLYSLVWIILWLFYTVWFSIIPCLIVESTIASMVTICSTIYELLLG